MADAALLCAQCGRPKPAGALEGLCPACVAKWSFRLDETNPETEEAAPAGELEPVRESEFTPKALPEQPRVTRFADYELLEELGRGGMGVVYRARQLRLNRLVAVKMIPFGALAGPEAVRRFRSEAEAVAQLQHPNIISIHEVGENNGQQFFSMDYIPGGTLEDRLRPGPLPARRAAAYLQTIARAIHYAHQRGILHRDLKPANILLDEQDQPRITDFGLAKRVENGDRPPASGAAGAERSANAANADLTLTGQVLGSPNYMSPEQACPGTSDAGPRSDIYSLGAMLYHTLTGRPPFQAESVPALLLHLLHDEPVALRALLPTIPRDLETICLKCLEKEPVRRYSTAEELAAELGRFLADEPILAKPAGVAERVWRWCRRKPALAATLALLLLVVLAGAAGVFLQWRRAEGAFALTRQNLYAADMELAYRAWTSGDLGQARQILTRYQPIDAKGATADLRHWEWRYLWGRCQGEEQLTLGSHAGAVVALDYSPVAPWLASGDVRGGLTIWDTAKGRARFSTNLLEGRINALAFSPDGRWLALSTRQHVSFWDCTRWQRAGTLAQPQVGHLAFSPDGQILAAVNGRDVCLWRLSDSALLKRLPTTAREPEPRKVAFNARGDLLAVGDANGRVTYWDGHSHAERETWRAHRPTADWEEWAGKMEDMIFSPTRDLLATAGGDKSVRLWTRPRQYVPLTNHTEAVTSVSFTRDGRQLVSGSMDQTVRVWDIAQRRELASWHAHAGGCLQVRWAPDGQSFASAGMDGVVKIWSPRQTVVRPLIHLLPTNAVDVIVLADPPILALTTADHSWQVRQARTFAPVQQGTGLTNNTDIALKSIRTGRLIEWSGRQLQFRTLPDGPLETFTTSDQGEIGSVDLSSDGQMLALSATDGLSLWNVPRRQRVRQWTTPNEGMHRHVRLAPNGSCIVTLQRFDGTVTFFEAGSAQQQSVPGHIIGASVVGFSPDSRWLATAGLGSAVRVYDVGARRELLALHNRSGHITALAFSPDGRRLAGGSSKGPIIIWDLDTGREVAWLTGHESLIYTLAFLDADTLASATQREFRLWIAPLITQQSRRPVDILPDLPAGQSF